MAVQTEEIGWHDGNHAMHRLMSAPSDISDPSSPFLTPSAAYLVQASPLLAVGALDAEGRPWTSIWGGEKGFATPVRLGGGPGRRGATAIGARCLVDSKFDPIWRILDSARRDGNGEESQISGLAIDLAERRRVKWAGTVLGMTAQGPDGGGEGPTLNDGVVDVQMVVKVTSSLGNCPKYLNKKTIVPFIPTPEIEPPTSPPSLSSSALSLIAAADLFFLTTTHNGTHHSTNHRGGPAGFLRHIPNTSPPQLVYPEYSGNRLYQTLGNMYTTPVAGLVIPDFTTGDVLFATTSARILTHKEASDLLPRSNLAVVLTLTEFSFVKQGLAFKAAPSTDPNAPSPYNPPVRYLTSEKPPAATNAAPLARAILIGRELLAPDIACYTFSLTDVKRDPTRPDRPLWTVGQHVALSFASELDHGYSHMRDDDPRSLNDDWVRTFTVSSEPLTESEEQKTQFSITVRAVGNATRFLLGVPLRSHLELPVLGFAGEFVLEGVNGGGVAFVAGGIGITPLLAQMRGLRASGTTVGLWWAIRGSEAQWACGTIAKWSRDASIESKNKTEALHVRLFVSGEVDSKGEKDLAALEDQLPGTVNRRRIQKEDFDVEHADLMSRWYLCAGKALSVAVEGWLTERGKEVIKENFDY